MVVPKQSTRRRIPRPVLFIGIVLVILLVQYIMDSSSSLSPGSVEILSPSQREMLDSARGEPLLVKPIFFVHFHKSGGTEACSLMTNSGKSSLVVTNEKHQPIKFDPHNCNAEGAGPYIDPRILVNKDRVNTQMLKSTAKVTCDNLLPYTTDQETGTPFRRNNFIATEVALDSPLPCPNVRNFALMRDPVSRVQSHMRLHHWNETHVRKFVTHEPNQPTPIGRHLKPLPSLGYPCINNMVIRQLLGYKRYTDYTPINMDDFKKAKSIIDQFDVFVPMDKQTHPIVSDLLKKHVPEYHEVLEFNPDEKAKLSQRRKSYAPSPDFVHLLKEQNKYDIMLYEYIHTKLGLEYQEQEPVK